MNISDRSFGTIAVSLARNPIGIIALNVLVYGFASLVTAFSGSMTELEKLPLIYFLIIFPVLVLAVFTWLVINHSPRLFSPGDYGTSEEYVRAIQSLTVAESKRQASLSKADLQGIIEVVRDAIPSGHPYPDGWRNQVLWVDDRPDNNVYERQALEATGIRFTLAESTNEALTI